MRKRMALLVVVARDGAEHDGVGRGVCRDKHGPGKGNPATTSSGKCPPGQDKDTSPGGLKKCG